MLDIQTGKIQRPIRFGLYGNEGIGKTTLAARMPDPLFIDTESGSDHLNVRRVKPPGTWDELIDIVKEVARTPGICKTLVIDTADVAEQLCSANVCTKYKQPGIESFGYGKGYTYLTEEWAHLLDACDDVIASGKHVVIIAHAKVRKFEQPDEMGAYDRWELKLSKQVGAMLKAWCDMLLFCNYKTYLVSAGTNGTKKAQGGQRVMYTTHHPCWDAKNRFDLPAEIPLDYNEIRHIFESADNSTTTEAASGAELNPLERLRALMQEAGITENEIKGFVVGQGYAPPDLPLDNFSAELVDWLLKYWADLVPRIRDAK